MRKPIPKPVFTLCAAVAVSAAVVATSCTPRIDTRGNKPEPELLTEVVPGEYTREDVLDILGSPSSKSTFGDETWYYISKRTETTAFWAPEIVEREVVAVQFDSKGRVARIDALGFEDGNRVILVDRETPTSGHELTVMEQLFGNLGRFAGSKQ